MKTKVTSHAAEHVELLRSFVNTLDREDGVDILDHAWLIDHGFVLRSDELGADDLGRLVELREAIRELLRANNDVAVDLAGVAAVLDASADRVGLAVRFRPDGTPSLQPRRMHGVDRATGRILAALAELTGTEPWSRLKACRWEECGWAFYDEARNRSRAWCSMASCGNRAKARAYRARS